MLPVCQLSHRAEGEPESLASDEWTDCVAWQTVMRKPKGKRYIQLQLADLELKHWLINLTFLSISDIDKYQITESDDQKRNIVAIVMTWCQNVSRCGVLIKVSVCCISIPVSLSVSLSRSVSVSLSLSLSISLSLSLSLAALALSNLFWKVSSLISALLSTTNGR